MITLLALSLVVGILVDDAIVEVENIVRHLRMGKTPYQAAMEAADEIGLAVIATTFTLIAVFLPTAFMSGIAGKFFKQFGWTAALAVFASLVVARLLTPMMAAYILKPIVGEHKDPRWMGVYLRWASGGVRHRWFDLLGATVLSLSARWPSSRCCPRDSSRRTTTRKPRSTWNCPRRHAGADPGGLGRCPPASHAGGACQEHLHHHRRRLGWWRPLCPQRLGRNAQGHADHPARRARQPAPQAGYRTEHPRGPGEPAGVRYKVGLGGSGEKYILVLTGDDPQTLTSAALAVEKDLRTIPGLGSISSTASLVRSEIAVRPDFARAADLGVTSSAIAETLRIATVGDYDVALSQLNLASRQIPIVVKLQDGARQDLALLERLAVPGSKGPVMLGQVAQLSFSGGPAVVDRYDRAQRQLRDRAVGPAPGRRHPGRGGPALAAQAACGRAPGHGR